MSSLKASSYAKRSILEGLVYSVHKFMEYEIPSLPVVSAIVERSLDGKREVLVQTRWKPERDPEYSGLIEIPAGVLRAYERVDEALRREVLEETGLNVGLATSSFSTLDDEREACIFFPFCCQQQLRNGRPWVGFVFLCAVEGGSIQPQADEVKDVRWISCDELRELLRTKPESFFPLQRDALRYYVQIAG